jgi:P-type E1-E2 ATPase
VIELQDIIKPGIQERFERLRKMGVKTVMVTGDNPLTAKYIATKAGVDDFIAEAKPEDKMNYIKKEQASGKLVAMMGDGTNDAPALAQADVGVAMNSGTQAAKEAGNMVDLDNDPTKLIEVVEIGKQLLITRGTLLLSLLPMMWPNILLSFRRCSLLLFLLCSIEYYGIEKSEVGYSFCHYFQCHYYSDADTAGAERRGL